MTPRLLVTDPSPVFRSSLRPLLEAEAPEREIVGAVTTGADAFSATLESGARGVLLENDADHLAEALRDGAGDEGAGAGRR